MAKTCIFNFQYHNLVEKATSSGEAILTSTGAVKAETGKYTGRSPKDKYIVEEDISKDKIDWGQ